MEVLNPSVIAVVLCLSKLRQIHYDIYTYILTNGLINSYTYISTFINLYIYYIYIFLFILQKGEY